MWRNTSDGSDLVVCHSGQLGPVCVTYNMSRNIGESGQVRHISSNPDNVFNIKCRTKVLVCV